MQRIDLRDGGWIVYDSHFISEPEAWFELLLREVNWQQEHSRFGPFPRLNAYFADLTIDYSYSGVTHLAADWPNWAMRLRHAVEAISGSPFNSLLLNRYRDGKDSIGFHSDYDSQVGRNPIIASLSFGATRKFVLKHIETNEKLSLDLVSGSLLLMAGTLQHHYHHGVPKTAQDCGERINLTFRNLLHPKRRGSQGSHGKSPLPESPALAREQ